jgi:hypothetical protein
MPYINPERRKALWCESRIDLDNEIRTKGELNFRITELMIDYIVNQGLSYTNISEAIAAANDAAEEMRRRILNPYEEKMIKKNGDCYQPLLQLLKKVK